MSTLTLHPEQLELQPERRRSSLDSALNDLDLAAMVRNHAAEHAEHLGAPRARTCRCLRRPWPCRDLGGWSCGKCGRRLA